MRWSGWILIVGGWRCRCLVSCMGLPFSSVSDMAMLVGSLRGDLDRRPVGSTGRRVTRPSMIALSLSRLPEYPTDALWAVDYVVR